jgi:hypothetical protein
MPLRTVRNQRPRFRQVPNTGIVRGPSMLMEMGAEEWETSQRTEVPWGI